MASYLYNGVKLPELPFSLSDYPYAIIYHNNAAVQSYDVFYSTSAFAVSADTPIVTIPSGTSRYRCSSLNSYTTWQANDTTSGVYTVTPIWTSYDLVLDGAVVLAASTPIPVLDIDPTALLQGYWVGKRLAAMRGKRKPVAYLYNGVRLPALPEWDKETYPYVDISYLSSDSDLCYLTFSDKPVTQNNGYMCIPANTSYLMHNAFVGDDAWAGNMPGVTEEDHNDWVSAELQIWANYDILNEDGTVYLAASEPVPVYE